MIRCLAASYDVNTGDNSYRGSLKTAVNGNYAEKSDFYWEIFETHSHISYSCQQNTACTGQGGKAMTTAKNMMKHAALILAMLLTVVMSGAIQI